MLKQRIITAIILIPLVVWSILALDSSIIAGLSAIFVILAAWEWAGLCGWQTWMQRSLYVVIMGIGLGVTYLYCCWHPEHLPNVFILLYGSIFWWLLAFFWVISYQQGFIWIPTHPLIKSLFGFFILLPAWMSLVALHEWDEMSLLFLLVLIWIADSGAYFVGKHYGKHKLADRISPGKTWEGVVGGLLAGGLFSVGYILLGRFLLPLYNQRTLFAYYFFEESLNTIIIFVGIAFITLVASILGDLLESLFKRQIGLKDSGQLLPGHGGVLDRIDSLTAAAPIFTFSLIIFF